MLLQVTGPGEGLIFRACMFLYSLTGVVVTSLNNLISCPNNPWPWERVGFTYHMDAKPAARQNSTITDFANCNYIP